jgi:hypothetical protein
MESIIAPSLHDLYGIRLFAQSIRRVCNNCIKMIIRE